MIFHFEPLSRADLPRLGEWLRRPHVARYWGEQTQDEVDEEFGAYLDPSSTTRGYLAYAEGRAIGFVQSYVVLGSGGGFWEDETDPGARGTDQFLADEADLGRGLGSAMLRAFVRQLFLDPNVTKVQTDPAPENARAIRCYERAGFEFVRQVVTPDGPALLYVCERPREPETGPGARSAASADEPLGAGEKPG